MKTRKPIEKWIEKDHYIINGVNWSRYAIMLATPKMGVLMGERECKGRVQWGVWYFYVRDEYTLEYACEFVTDDRQAAYRMFDYRYDMMVSAANEGY